jgi:hypothetical protein
LLALVWMNNKNNFVVAHAMHSCGYPNEATNPVRGQPADLETDPKKSQIQDDRARKSIIFAHLALFCNPSA